MNEKVYSEKINKKKSGMREDEKQKKKKLK